MGDSPPFEDFGYVYLALLRGAPAAYSAAVLRPGPAPRCRSAPPRGQDGGVGGHRAASLISAYRAAHGLKSVRVDAHLIRSAEHQARAVAQLGWLSHGDFAGRMASFGIRGKAAENLSAGLDSVDQVIAQWQASSGHNANLLMPDFARVGLARASSDRTYWVLVLAR